MQAVILAAGMGKRLKDLTKDNTKCMIRVNGTTLIERLLGQLGKYRLNKIIIVVGYQGCKLIDFIKSLNIKTKIEFIDNPIYDKTNNIYSLSLAKKNLCEDDTLLFESDLIVEDSVIQSLVDDPRETLALVDRYESWMDGTCVKLSSEDDITEFVPGKKFKYAELKEYYKTVNIYKFSKHFSQTYYVPFLEAYSNAMGNNEYYEQVLKIVTMLDDPEIKAKRLNGERWYEIDDIQDLDIAESMFLDGEQKVKAIQSRYGGYWRYPKLIDFCYLVNPYFPPQRLIDEIKASFEKLLTQYPSGIRVNSLLAAKDFGVKQENIVLGNGAAELIKSVMTVLDGKLGVIRPTFEEYTNRYVGQQIVYTPDNEDFAYQAEDVIGYFDDKDIKSLVLINPDNPTGNFIATDGLNKLIEWSNKKNIRLFNFKLSIEKCYSKRGAFLTITHEKINIKTKLNNKTAINQRLARCVCFIIILSHILLFLGENNSLTYTAISYAIKLLISFIYLYITKKAFPRLDKNIRLLLILILGYLVIRTLVSRIFSPILMNFPIVVALLICNKLDFNKRDIKKIGLCSILCFFIVYLNFYFDGDSFYINYFFHDLQINRNIIGMAIVVNMYMALLLVTKKSKKLNLFQIIIYFVGLIMLIKCASRTSLICGILLILLHIYSIKRKRINYKRLKKVFYVVLLASLLSAIVILYFLAPVMNSVVGYSFFSSREFIYYEAIDKLNRTKSWLFGYGFEVFAPMLSGNLGKQAHNQWLQFVVNYGIVFLIVIVYLFVRLINNLVRKRQKVLTLLFMQMQLIIFIYAISEMIFSHYYSAYLFSSIYFTCCGNLQCQGKKKDKINV